MLKKSLIGLAVVALVASAASAGGLKVYGWDYTVVTTWDTEVVTTLEVKVKVPWWIRIEPQDPIVLLQTAFNANGTANYSKTVTETVTANFSGKLSLEVTNKTLGSNGTWVVSIAPDTFDAGNSNHDLTVTVNNLDLSLQQVCTTIKLADLVIKVTPTGLTAPCQSGTVTCP